MLTKDTREVWLIQPPHHLMWINSLRVGEAERGAASFPVTGEGMWWSPSTKKALICESHEGKEPAAPPHSSHAATVSSRRTGLLMAPSHGKSHAIFSTQKHNRVKRQKLYEMPLFLFEMYDQKFLHLYFCKNNLEPKSVPSAFPRATRTGLRILWKHNTESPQPPQSSSSPTVGVDAQLSLRCPGTELPSGHWAAMSRLQAKGGG